MYRHYEVLNIIELIIYWRTKKNVLFIIGRILHSVEFYVETHNMVSDISNKLYDRRLRE